VAGAAAASEKSDLMIITSSGKVIRMPAGGISVVGRNTMGVRLVDVEGEDDKVVAMMHLQGEEAEDSVLDVEDSKL
jgi:DNA gyrase subunit A